MTFVDDCSATYDAAKHAATLRNMDDQFGVVTTSREIMESRQRVPELAG